MDKLVVTGGCGFIGSHFISQVFEETDYYVINVDLLTYASNKANVSVSGNEDRYTFYNGDVADPNFVNDILKNERPTAIVNFAAESHVDRSILDASVFLKTNVIGTGTLMSAARLHGVEKFIQISTDEVS